MSLTPALIEDIDENDDQHFESLHQELIENENRREEIKSRRRGIKKDINHLHKILDEKSLTELKLEVDDENLWITSMDIILKMNEIDEAATAEIADKIPGGEL